MPTPPDRIRVLHVDDDEGYADVVSTLLEREDDAFEVETASDVDAGLARLDAGAFDCVVSDYEMPGQDGIDFLEAVRAEYPDLPFVLFTGVGSEDLASEAIAAGVTDYLQKGSGPGKYAVLANRIRNAVEQYRSRRALVESERRLSLLFEESPLGIVEMNGDPEFVRANPRVAEILGYEESDLVGEPWHLIVPDDERGTVTEVLDDLLATGGPQHSVNENVTADGERVVCEWHNSVVTDDEGEVVTVFSKFRDVTDEYRRRERRERQAAALVDLSTDPAVVGGDFETAVERITETAAEVLSVGRVNLWLFEDEGTTLRCVGGYDRRGDADDAGVTVAAEEYPEYFEALRTSRVVRAGDARADARTAGLAGTYLDVHGVDSLLDATLRSEGEVVGVVCHEALDGPREWSDDEAEFAADVADVAARALRNRDRVDRQRRLAAVGDAVEGRIAGPLATLSRTLEGEADDGVTDPRDPARRRALARLDGRTTDLSVLARGPAAVGATEPVDLGSAARECWSRFGAAGELRVGTGATVRADPDLLGRLLANAFRAVLGGRPGARADDGDDALADRTVTVDDLDGGDGFYVAGDGAPVGAGTAPPDSGPDHDSDPDRDPGPAHDGQADGTRADVERAVVRAVAAAHGWRVAVREGESGGVRLEFRGVESPD